MDARPMLSDNIKKLLDLLNYERKRQAGYFLDFVDDSHKRADWNCDAKHQYSAWLKFNQELIDLIDPLEIKLGILEKVKADGE